MSLLQKVRDFSERLKTWKGMQAEPTPAKEIAAPACPQGIDAAQGLSPADAEHRLTLDFSPYPEVLKEIKRLAHHEERLPEVQARYMLKRALQQPGRYSPMFITDFAGKSEGTDDDHD